MQTSAVTSLKIKQTGILISAPNSYLHFCNYILRLIFYLLKFALDGSDGNAVGDSVNVEATRLGKITGVGLDGNAVGDSMNVEATRLG